MNKCQNPHPCITRKDGAPSQRTRVYEVLQGKRSLSLNMIRELYEKFGIPAHVLIQPGRKGRETAGRGSSRRLRSARLKKVSVELRSCPDFLGPQQTPAAGVGMPAIRAS